MVQWSSRSPARDRRSPEGFIEPCQPVLSAVVSVGSDWVHELKHTAGAFSPAKTAACISGAGTGVTGLPRSRASLRRWQPSRSNRAFWMARPWPTIRKAGPTFTACIPDLGENEPSWSRSTCAKVATWLTCADRNLMAIACHLQSEFREQGPAMSAARVRVLVSALASLGFTPATRSRIGTPRSAAPEANPFAGFNS
jgi:hypothetical protein